MYIAQGEQNVVSVDPSIIIVINHIREAEVGAQRSIAGKIATLVIQLFRAEWSMTPRINLVGST